MRLLRPVLVLAAAACFSGCSRPQPNVVLVTFDTTRWDHVGYATGQAGLTPNLDAAAARGTWFSTAMTVQPMTLPAHTSILTGLYPFHHGVRNNGTYIVPPETVTLAERLHDAGYATQAMVSAFVLDSQFGLDQGFDDYDDDFSGGPRQKMFMFKELPAARRADRAIDWLKTKRPQDRPFFLWMHFFDPHADYDPPDDVAKQFAGDPYSGEIHYADRELGRVLATLEQLGLTDRTVFVFTSDHGDGLGEHGEKTHGMFVYDSTTHVPLLIAGPGVPAGQKVDAVASTVDIVPTVLELLGLGGGEGLDGRSLRGLWDGEHEGRRAYSETMMPRLNFGWSELRALRSDEAKVILAPRPEEYALQADPSEKDNLHGRQPGAPQAEELRSRLAAFVEDDPFTRGGQQEADLDDETRSRLTALGYVWSAPAEDPAGGPRPDPKDRVVFWEQFQGAQDLMRRGSHAEAIEAIESLLLVDANNVLAMGSLANALAAIGEREKSLEVYRKMIALDPKRETPYLGASKLLREMGQFAQSEELARAVIELQPKNPAGYTNLGDLFLEQERVADAEPWFRKAIEIDPHSSLAASGLGNCLKRAGKPQDAMKVLRAAYQRDPTSLAVTYNLGVVSEVLGDAKAAQAFYAEAIQLDPDHSMSWNNLGSLLDRLGNRKEAIEKISRAHELDPENVEATYNLGALLLLEGDAAKALPLLEKALQEKPGFPQAALLRARALQKLGRTDEAIAAWEQMAPKSPVAWLQIARLELARGQEASAREAIRKGLEQDGEKVRKAAAKDPHLQALLPPP